MKTYHVLNKNWWLIGLLFILSLPTLYTQEIQSLIVEIKTGDVRFAGTDDNIHLQIGGKDFYLDDPDRDDFERNNTDRFVLSTANSFFTAELIIAVGNVCVEKTEDSFFGGGWNFEGIAIWADSDANPPIYQNNAVNKWLDGDDLAWHSNFGEPGWNLPEDPPFPPCVVIDVDSGRLVDSDCDGIPDRSDDVFDENPPDQDGDGLPDNYEDQNGLSSTDPDSDNDGWWDGNNKLSILLLTKIVCHDEEEDIGVDEIYINCEDVRYPLSPTLDNYWPMNDGTTTEPFRVIDRRAVNGAMQGNYISRIKLREADFEFFESPTDDTYASFELNWEEEGTYELTHQASDEHFVLSFRSFTISFFDPNPLSVDADQDRDDLSEELEFQITSQDPALRNSSFSAVDGYNGLAFPKQKEMFIEVDASGGDHKLPFEAKQMVASQFHHQDIWTRVDDGYLQGGEILPHVEIITFDDLKDQYHVDHMWDERKDHFRYALFVDKMEEEFLGAGSNGRADRPGTRMMVSRTTMLGDFSAIVFIHEWGHTLGLCHPEGTKEPPIPSPTCPLPANWVGCQYCGVDDNSVTAMGDDIGGDSIIAGAVGVAIIGGLIGAAFGPWGIVIGAIVGGIIGGLLGLVNSDAWMRVVNFDVVEWAVLNFMVF